MAHTHVLICVMREIVLLVISLFIRSAFVVKLEERSNAQMKTKEYRSTRVGKFVINFFPVEIIDATKYVTTVPVKTAN